MFRSLQTSRLVLRVGLAAVFLWLGAEQILGPDAWANEWLSVAMRDGIRGLGMSPRDPVLLAAILEVLVGISLVSGYFIRVFASIGGALILTTVLVQGYSAQTVFAVGSLAGLVAVIVWPERTGWQE